MQQLRIREHLVIRLAKLLRILVLMNTRIFCILRITNLILKFKFSVFSKNKNIELIVQEENV
jgi:hypothetical protein